MCAFLPYQAPAGRSPSGRLDPFAAPFGYDRYLRNPAEDRRPSPAVVPLRAWTDRSSERSVDLGAQRP
jgi:hypothetical protein